MTGSMFCFCPHCGSDLRQGTVTGREGDDCRHGCDRPEHYSRIFGIYDPDADRTVAWQCPDCGKRWER